MYLAKSIGRLALCVSALVSVAQADTIVDSLTFGFGKRLAPWGQKTIPGWQIVSEGHEAEVMSDRVILTPPYPGSKRGALWADTAVTQEEWTIDFDFRSNGEERGSGNLQLWYVKDGKNKVGTASIYTVGQFDGFALVIDTNGGRGGSVRGFLNDGNTDYKAHQSVDSLAFGHCEYAYRNRGRPSKIQVKHTATTFEVLVDNGACFKTDRVALPPGNSFGVTAASAENPDSFEIFKFAMSIPEPGNGGNNAGHRNYQAQYQPPPAAQVKAAPNTGGGINIDLSALQKQINDLQTRLNSLASSTDKILSELSSESKRADERQHEVLRRSAPRDQLNGMDSRMQRVEKVVEAVQKDLQGNKQHFSKLQDAVQRSHSGLLEKVQSTSNMVLSSAPRMGMFIFLVVAFQMVLAGAYVWYKRRRANMPKKFL